MTQEKDSLKLDSSNDNSPNLPSVSIPNSVVPTTPISDSSSEAVQPVPMATDESLPSFPPDSSDDLPSFPPPSPSEGLPASEGVANGFPELPEPSVQEDSLLFSIYYRIHSSTS